MLGHPKPAKSCLTANISCYILDDTVQTRWFINSVPEGLIFLCNPIILLLYLRDRVYGEGVGEGVGSSHKAVSLLWELLISLHQWPRGCAQGWAGLSHASHLPGLPEMHCALLGCPGSRYWCEA